MYVQPLQSVWDTIHCRILAALLLFLLDFITYSDKTIFTGFPSETIYKVSSKLVALVDLEGDFAEKGIG